MMAAAIDEILSFEERLFNLLYTTDKRKDVTAKSMLANLPGSFDVNWKNKGKENMGFLHVAAGKNRPEMVFELLRHPNIKLNEKDHFQATPFIMACANNAVECVAMLLDDLRVDVNYHNDYAETGLIRAAHWGEISPIAHILASLRHIQRSDIEKAIIQAKVESFWGNKPDYPKLVNLLEAYQTQPFDTVKDLRIQLKLQENGPVGVFVHMILLADGYYKLRLTNKNKNVNGARARRFFEFLLRLPIELQMLTCNRIFDLPKNIIKGGLVEKALRFMIADQILTI